MNLVNRFIERILGTERKRRLYQSSNQWLRKKTGKNNSRIFKKTSRNLSRKFKVSFDCQTYQLCKNERATWYKVKEPNEHWDIDSGFIGPYNPEHSERLEKEIPYIYAICELIRTKDIARVELNTVSEERKKAPDKHTDQIGCIPLDFDVKDLVLSFGCESMSLGFTNFLPSTENAKKTHKCSFYIDRYQPIFAHMTGKGQRRDAWHYILSDYFGVDVFITCDLKFRRAFDQIRHKLEGNGVETKVMYPSEFCRKLRISKIGITIADHRALFRKQLR